MKHFICVTCGMQYAPPEKPPEACPVCLDERQYVGHGGQQWTTLDDYRRTHENVFAEEEPGLHSIHPHQKARIGQRVWEQSVYPLARRMGVEIRLPPVSPQPHTHLAWEGFQFAREHGKGTEYNHRVLKTFFVEGLDIGRPDVLARLAAEVGLDPAAFRAAVEGRRYRDAHRAALRHAPELGITGVPAFEIGDRLLVGVQPQEVLEAAIAATRPPSDASSACGPSAE